MPKKPIHHSIKTALGYEENIRDSELLRDWNKRLEQICKPCWELKYCPYGPLVEGFPLLPVVRSQAEEHQAYLKTCLETEILGDGRPLDDERKRDFEERVRNFKPEELPKEIPPVLEEAGCRVFGHVCPVFLVAEPLTETKVRRAHSRYISNEVMIKVVRRDGQICQICNQPVPDNEVEFDHKIPFSRGGTTTAENLRLVHADCNREKGDVLSEILHPSPIEHLFEIQRGAKPKARKKTR